LRCPVCPLPTRLVRRLRPEAPLSSLCSGGSAARCCGAAGCVLCTRLPGFGSVSLARRSG
jgi:hypothetical protein